MHPKSRFSYSTAVFQARHRITDQKWHRTAALQVRVMSVPCDAVYCFLCSVPSNSLCPQHEVQNSTKPKSQQEHRQMRWADRLHMHMLKFCFRSLVVSSLARNTGNGIKVQTVHGSPPVLNPCEADQPLCENVKWYQPLWRWLMYYHIMKHTY